MERGKKRKRGGVFLVESTVGSMWDAWYIALRDFRTSKKTVKISGKKIHPKNE